MEGPPIGSWMDHLIEGAPRKSTGAGQRRGDLFRRTSKRLYGAPYWGHLPVTLHRLFDRGVVDKSTVERPWFLQSSDCHLNGVEIGG